ncbi:MAG: hypothetical protein E7246_05115 [Lachnoclostridium sp.]|nr:hypothetical protein [Lachnoclostridium sp.]
MFKKMQVRLLSFLLTVAMVLGMMPVSALAARTRNGGAENVYISVSYDGQFIADQNGDAIAYVPVSLSDVASIDLESYGLGEYLYDENLDGTPDITALQLIIYAHENLYGGNWSDVTFTGSPGSSYFAGGIFGFDENLNYYLNGEYPLASAGWGATSDQIVLEAGDYIDLASFSSWDFYMDSNYGFHFFANEDDEFTHAYTAEAGEALSVKLVRSYSGMGSGATVYDEADYTVFYGSSYGNETGTVTTDGSGCAEITFPSAGTWYLWADGGYGAEYPESIVSAPAYAVVSVTAGEAENSTPEEPQEVSEVLTATMKKLAETVTEPAFGTDAGEWTVFSLARGGYFEKDHTYFTDYYDRIVETVNETAASVNMNGALHKNKSTENSRLIVALSALGKDATSVGDWNLIEPYDDFTWIKKQGLNGTIWALIALDSNDYETDDTTIRQQCVDAILEAQHNDGGWALTANKEYASDPDVTGMALTALYPYRDQEAVKTACDEAFECLSGMQHENGAFESGGSECSESCAWVIIACTIWDINPDTDSRFIKNEKSVVDALLAHYMEEEARFQHIIGAGANGMATDQSCYALVAYDRLLNEKTGLFDYSDVDFETSDTEEEETDEMTVKLGIPDEISANKESFNAILSINKWDNDAGYKLIDFIMSVPEELSVKDVIPGSRLEGGEVQFNLEEDTGKLRVVYFDANQNSDITISGSNYPAELFTVKFGVGDIEESLDIAVTGMSVKLSSDSSADDSMIVVNTEKAKGTVDVISSGISLSAVCLYTGDGVDLIPSDKKAVAIAVTGVDQANKLLFDDGSNEIEFLYSAEITEKTDCLSYVAIVDASIKMTEFTKLANYTFENEHTTPIVFGDSNNDGWINAQDALATVDAWLRKGEKPDDREILAMNVNGDSRINTFDALGIVEAFVDHSDLAVVIKAATLNGEGESDPE